MDGHRRRLPRSERELRARRIAQDYDGIAHRRDLRRVGVTRGDVHGEVVAGRWVALGKHTVVVVRQAWLTRSAWFHAIWESGSGSVLDGVAALHASGLVGFAHDQIDIAIPRNNRRHTVRRVTLHTYSTMPAVMGGGVPRVRPELAVLHAAQWARTDRMAALLLVLVVEQRIITPQRLLETFEALTRCTRRRFLAGVIADICDGVRSLSELDFARICRRYGLPPPSRQVLRQLPSGRVYLDVRWDHLDLVVEIDGGHHFQALGPMADALRQNEVVLTGDAVLRIPALGLRLEEAQFMDQLVRAHQLAPSRGAAA